MARSTPAAREGNSALLRPGEGRRGRESLQGKDSQVWEIVSSGEGPVKPPESGAKVVSRMTECFRGSTRVFAFLSRESRYGVGRSRITAFEIFPVAPRPPNRGTPHYEAHLSTQRATPQAQARFSLPHADPLGACRHQATSPQGTPATHCLGTDARSSRCGLRRDSPPSTAPVRPGEPVELP